VEIVLETCTHYASQDGEIHEFTAEIKAKLNKVINEYAENSLRCLCLAYKNLNPNEGG